MKKIVVYMLAFVLVIGMINVTFVAKANTYTEVTLTGTDVYDSKVNGDQWAIFLLQMVLAVLIGAESMKASLLR